MSAPVIRPIGDDDVAWILALNAANEAATSPLDAPTLRLMLGDAAYARAIGQNDGFIIAFDQTSAYKSVNYQWFRVGYLQFMYVDRIVIDANARKGGLARALYEDMFLAARRAGHGTAACEVNIDPPNTASDAFHDRLGFVEVGKATLPNGKTVRYMIKALPA
jgi:uncharacterized protein